MDQQYASTQPAGFQNKIQNIALVGARLLGSHFLISLLTTKKHNITASLVLKEPNSPTHPSIKIRHIDYASPASLAAALKGQDVLIITMPVMAPPEQEESLIRAVAEPDVKFLAKCRKLIENLGVSKCLVVTGGFWYEYSLAGTEARYGFDFKEKKVTCYGSGTAKINTSTWEQLARAVAALLSLPIFPENSKDTSTTVSNFMNKTFFISSFRVSQRDMLEPVLCVTRGKESDWTMFGQGNVEGFGIAMYARTFFDDGAGDFETRIGQSNDVLGLPQEDFDACTAKTVERASKLAGSY
ncbi:putative oxidoreductase CipA [Rhexocercosporidium sp. MPI-PUGE-AT-0058]|nr:putative oxidoreductase CipA [Rhexocercosporidium sp. MPI-PUGE-AT-0058]